MFTGKFQINLKINQRQLTATGNSHPTKITKPSQKYLTVWKFKKFSLHTSFQFELLI